MQQFVTWWWLQVSRFNVRPDQLCKRVQAPFRLALALLMQSPQQWGAVGPSALQHALETRFPGASSGSAAAGGDGGGQEPADEQQAADQRWQVAAPAVRFFGAVDFLQRKLKAPTDAASGWQAALSHR